MGAYFDTGFSVREPSWHGQATVLSDYPENWQDAREKAGLTWEPIERPAFMLRPDTKFRTCILCGAGLGSHHEDACEHKGVVTQPECIPVDGYLTPAGVFVPIPDQKLLLRNDTDAVLGIRSDEYSTIYHGEKFAQEHDGGSMEEVIDVFAGQANVKFETAGSLHDGRYVWALFFLDEPYTVPGDDTEHLSFFALVNPHAGQGAAKLINTQVRIICWNTAQAAEMEAQRTGREFTFRHVGDVATRIDEAKAALAGLRDERKMYVEMAEELSTINVDDKFVETFLGEFLPSPRENGEHCTDRVHDNVVKARTMFRHVYLDSVTTESIRGNGFGLLSASIEYLDHVRAYRNRDSYLGRSILRAEPAKAKALQLVRTIGGLS